MKTISLFLLSCCLLCFRSVAEVKLPRLISDNMVLQRNVRLQIWGWAAPGEKVQVDFVQHHYNTVTGKDGKWKVMLPPMNAGGPFNMTITGNNAITISNILIGDVWLCSGQSNMELSMERLKDKYPAIIKTASNPEIRQFNVSTTITWEGPQEDYKTGNWAAVTPQSIYGFSAVGYFFAEQLYQRYHIPIGIIKCATGGSTAEAWLDEHTLQQFPDLLATAKQFQQKNYVDSLKARDIYVNDVWYTHLWQSDAGLQGPVKWYDTTSDYSTWKTFKVPALWKEQGITDSQGAVWFQKEVVLSKDFASQPAQLWLGNMIDRDSVFVNGRFAGTTGYQYPPRKYPIPAGMLKEGKNSIVVRVINYSGAGGFYKDKRYQLFNSRDTIDLRGDWRYNIGCTSAAIPPTVSYWLPPLGLNNGMIAPLKNLSLKGVIWYQGEANTGNPAAYTKIFPALINSWRDNWKNQSPDKVLPFFFVQLASYMETREQPAESNWAALRAVQAQTQALPATGMAVTIDIGEWNDIHPLNKADVGKRLALCAMHTAYGEKDVICQGPVLQQAIRKGNQLVLTFNHTDQGLKFDATRPGQFAIAGADNHYVWAKATLKGNQVIVWNDAITTPTTVRYAWADTPAATTLSNGAGLPASPFQYQVK
ncbi:sialate O-acetylesterase [Chitinophaga sp. Cy-1792]|uniref:sialate O-acetylesterase n=1 Tax=Chitinophaga sp. Cy-1792 TaxID=2608339 RepID=UPI00141E4DBF|nr:sialate O-acetylesterase [Chitinophaga sp. Cy-1792]NIG55989.1 sialate O-acetylesterase [Chitinophaga sp. Cy-1792]